MAREFYTDIDIKGNLSLTGQITGSLASVSTDGLMAATDKAKLDGVGTLAPASDITGITGADRITNIVSLTQAEYNAIASPSASTLYVVTD